MALIFQRISAGVGTVPMLHFRCSTLVCDCYKEERTSKIAYPKLLSAVAGASSGRSLHPSG